MSENPDQEMFRLMNRKIVVIKSDLFQDFRGNTRGRLRHEVNIDIYDRRELPKRPRESLPIPIFKKGILKIASVKPLTSFKLQFTPLTKKKKKNIKII